jgi:hypothetical protein
MAEAESAFPGSENPFRAASSFLDKVLPRSVASLPEGLFLGADGENGNRWASSSAGVFPSPPGAA